MRGFIRECNSAQFSRIRFHLFSGEGEVGRRWRQNGEPRMVPQYQVEKAFQTASPAPKSATKTRLKGVTESCRDGCSVGSRTVSVFFALEPVPTLMVRYAHFPLWFLQSKIRLLGVSGRPKILSVRFCNAGVSPEHRDVLWVGRTVVMDLKSQDVVSTGSTPTTKKRTSSNKYARYQRRHTDSTKALDTKNARENTNIFRSTDVPLRVHTRRGLSSPTDAALCESASAAG